METEIQKIGSFENKIEHENLVNFMASKLQSIELPQVSECCIYRVPQRTREINEAAYTPRVVSIGPLHQGDKRLELMEELKLRYLKSFLERTQKKLEDCIRKLKEEEKRIRDCYAHTVLQSSDHFVKMILTDASFIIEYFSRRSNSEVSIDPILSQPRMQEDVERDLLFLENQLPFFVLEGLFTPTCANGRFTSFLELSFQHFQCRFASEEQQRRRTFNHFCEEYPVKRQPSGKVEVQHFTDLLRMFYLPPLGSRGERENTTIHPTHNASQLVEAGVEMHSGKKNGVIEFSGSKLTIPCLTVEDRTELLLRNIVALEQCHYPFHSYVTDYVELRDILIDSTKDVDILVRKGIMINLLGDSTKVAAMVNDLCREIGIFNRGVDYIELYRKLHKFCQAPIHKYKANLKHDYFNTPCRTASSIAAIVLLLLTLIQTICSVISLSLNKCSANL